VGRDNYRWFFGYAFMFFICSSLWLITAYLYLTTVAFSWIVLAVALMFVPFWCMSIMLSSYHVTLTMSNLTTNEQMNYGRYEYLQHGVNLYDKGIMNNFINRFFPPKVDRNVEEVERLLNNNENNGIEMV
jgi:hypothetical protein